MADIQLSPQLFEDIQDAVQKQHPDADQVVVMQYMAAVMGYLLGSQNNMPPDNRDALMDELCAFTRHVYEDVARSQQQQAERPPAGDAFVIWEPPAK